MKKAIKYSLGCLLIFLMACAKDGLWNQEAKVNKGQVLGLLVNTDDENPLKGVKVVLERQTKASGSTSFVDTLSTDESGRFVYELPFPNKLKIVIRDTGRYQADTARLEVLTKKDYEVQLNSHPRFGTTQILAVLLDEMERPMPDLRIELLVKEASDEPYSSQEILTTDAQGQVLFRDVAFPVRFKVALAERPIAYEYVYQEGEALTKDEVRLRLTSKARFQLADLNLRVGDYYKAKPRAYGKLMMAMKSAIEDEFDDFQEFDLDDQGKLSLKNSVFPMEIKIKPTPSGHPFEEMLITVDESFVDTEYAFEIKDAIPRYAQPIYTNLVVSSLAIPNILVNPTGVATDKKGNLFITDGSGNKIVKVDRFGDMSVLLSGTGSVDGPLATATVNQPWGIVADAEDNLYFVDNRGHESSHKVRKISFDQHGNGLVRTIAGKGGAGGSDGAGTDATFSRPAGLALDQERHILYVSEWSGNRIRKVDLASSDYRVSTLIGSGTSANTEGVGLSAEVFQPSVAIALSPDANQLYIGCNASNSNANSRLGLLDLQTNQYRFYLGAGGSYAAAAPRGMFITSTGDMLYTTNGSPKSIRKVDLGQTVGAAAYTTIAGSNASGSVDGPAHSARFSSAIGICYDPYTGTWYIAEGDSNPKKIRVMRPADLD